MSKQVKIYGEPADRFEFLKPVGKTNTDTVVPFYGVFEKNNLLIRRVPLIAPNYSDFDKKSFLFPLYSYDEMTQFTKIKEPIISYTQFIKEIELGTFDESFINYYVVVTPKDIKNLYDNQKLSNTVQEYFESIYKKPKKRTRK